MHIYHLKNCDTCKRAISELGERVSKTTDVRSDGVPSETISNWLARLGPDVLVNRRSATWRGLTDEQKAGDPLKLLIEHPTLLKRPVIVDGDRVFIGWGREVRSALS